MESTDEKQLGLHSQLLQVLREDVQRDIIREDDFRTSPAQVRMRLGTSHPHGPGHWLFASTLKVEPLLQEFHSNPPSYSHIPPRASSQSSASQPAGPRLVILVNRMRSRGIKGAGDSPGALGRVRRGGVELGSQESGLTAVLVAVHQARHWEPPFDNLQGVLLRCLHHISGAEPSRLVLMLITIKISNAYPARFLAVVLAGCTCPLTFWLVSAGI